MTVTNSVNCGTSTTANAPCYVALDVQVSPLQIDLAGGVSIAGAILAVWAAGFAIRMVIRALNTDGDSTQEPEP